MRVFPYREHGKRLLFTTGLTLTVPEIWDVCNHDKLHIFPHIFFFHIFSKDDFFLKMIFVRRKASDMIRIQSIRHGTDSKIRVNALICVLALLARTFWGRTACDAGLTRTPTVLQTEPEDIQQIYLEMSGDTGTPSPGQPIDDSTATLYRV